MFSYSVRAGRAGRTVIVKMRAFVHNRTEDGWGHMSEALMKLGGGVAKKCLLNL